MDQGTLVTMIGDGQRLLQELSSDGFEVAAAAWVKDVEDDLWHLYVVSHAVDEKGLASANRLTYPALTRIGDPWMGLFQLRLIGTANPMAQDIIHIQTEHPGWNSRDRVPRLGNRPVDQVYVYPPVPDWRGFWIPVYPIQGERDAYRVVFCPRQLMAERVHGGEPKRVPRPAEVEVVAGRATRYFPPEAGLESPLTQSEYEKKAIETVRFETAQKN